MWLPFGVIRLRPVTPRVYHITHTSSVFVLWTAWITKVSPKDMKQECSANLFSARDWWEAPDCSTSYIDPSEAVYGISLGYLGFASLRRIHHCFIRVNLSHTPRKLRCMLYPWGNSTSPCNAAGISHKHCLLGFYLARATVVSRTQINIAKNAELSTRTKYPLVLSTFMVYMQYRHLIPALSTGRLSVPGCTCQKTSQAHQWHTYLANHNFIEVIDIHPCPRNRLAIGLAVVFCPDCPLT